MTSVRRFCGLHCCDRACRACDWSRCACFAVASPWYAITSHGTDITLNATLRVLCSVFYFQAKAHLPEKIPRVAAFRFDLILHWPKEPRILATASQPLLALSQGQPFVDFLQRLVAASGRVGAEHGRMRPMKPPSRKYLGGGGLDECCNGDDRWETSMTVREPWLFKLYRSCGPLVL